ncbi:hypothetical protein ILUMI_20403 [Ignelater luminosus]|uniref:Serpin domain-containing protein n=1 Tax=Ignelater luminosus TaxID=2038154 RepID=A0A8K0CJS3_IGNLU|nr:hypothetical protein ILUMI_20403 [Ignelater luminosus]
MNYYWIVSDLPILLFLCLNTRAENMNATIKDLNSFNNAIYKIFSRLTPENMINFPINIYTSLLFIYYGTNGKSAKQIVNAFDSISFPKEYNKLINDIKRNKKISTIFHNHVFVQDNMKVTEDYKKFLSMLSTNMSVVNFDKLSDGFKQQLPQTLRSSKFLNSEARLLVLNRMSFRGKWKTPFATTHTGLTEFYELNDQNSRVPTMKKYNEQFRYVDSIYLQSRLLEIPFSDERFSLIFLLPAEVHGLIKSLGPKLKDTKTILDNISKMKTKFFHNIEIPKFVFQKHLTLTRFMYELNIKEIFSPNADFSHLSSEPTNIKEIFQRIKINVNEKEMTLASDVTIFGGKNLKSKRARTDGERKLPAKERRQNLPFYLISSTTPSLSTCYLLLKINPTTPTPKSKLKTEHWRIPIRRKPEHNLKASAKSSKLKTKNVDLQTYLTCINLITTGLIKQRDDKNKMILKSSFSRAPSVKVFNQTRRRKGKHPRTFRITLSEYKVVHPFAFVLFDRQLNMILAIGKCTDHSTFAS